MLQKLTMVVTSLALLVGVFTFVPEAVYAATSDSKAAVCEGLNATGAATGCESGGTTVDSVIKTAIQLLSLVAGVAAVIMIIVAGIRYITSGGDASGVKGAKDAIIYAIVGLIVVVLSQAIVQFVMKNVK